MKRSACPDDRPLAGREFTYGAGEYLGSTMLTEKSGRTEAEVEAEEAIIKVQREAGLHCLSGWDGNYDALEDLVRTQLFAPGSMDTVDTVIAPANEDGKHPVTMVFMATDVYENTVLLTAFGLADDKTCRAELLWNE